MADIDSSTWKTYGEMDPDLKALLPSLPPAPKRIADYDSATEARKDTRARMQSMVQSGLIKVPDWTGCTRTEISIPMREGSINRGIVMRRNEGEVGGLYIFFHGGGWANGMPEAGEKFGEMLVKEFGFVVVSVGYRLAPEHVFPTAAEDAVDAVKWLVTNASCLPANPSKSFIIAGASAGANIACVAAHVAVDDGLSPAPTGVVLNSPLVCHYEAMPEQYKKHAQSWEENKDSMILSQRDVRWLYDNYKIDPKSPYASPLIWQSHKGQPATYMQVMGMDPMRDEALIYEHILQQARTPTKVTMYPGLPHGGPDFLPMHPSAKKAMVDLKGGVEWILIQQK